MALHARRRLQIPRRGRWRDSHLADSRGPQRPQLHVNTQFLLMMYVQNVMRQYEHLLGSP